jgi:hypothetical protein
MFDFKLINNLYFKREIPKQLTDEEILVVIYYLSQDKNMHKILIEYISYLFIIKPIHLYTLLYYSFPIQNRIPYFKKIEKIEKTIDIVLLELSKIFNWNNRDIQLIEPIFNLNTLQKIKKELGIE